MENEKNVEKIVKLTLIRMGFKCDLKGFTYLVKSVMIVIENPMLAYNLKKLFSIVAKEFEIEQTYRIESNIQNAINQAYIAKNGFESINRLFGMNIVKDKRKPTAAEIIKLTAEYYSLDLYVDENNKTDLKENLG